MVETILPHSFKISSNTRFLFLRLSSCVRAASIIIRMSRSLTMHDLMEVFGVASVLARLQLYLVDQFRDLDRSRLIIFLCQQHLVISQIICVQSSTVLVLMLHKSDDAHAVLIVATFFVGICSCSAHRRNFLCRYTGYSAAHVGNFVWNAR